MYQENDWVEGIGWLIALNADIKWLREGVAGLGARKFKGMCAPNVAGRPLGLVRYGAVGRENAMISPQGYMSIVYQPQWIGKAVSIFPEYRSRLWWVCLVMAALIALLFCGVTAYASGWGGYISEKLIDRAGVADSNLLIGRSGVADSALDVAMSGILASPSATNIYIDHATVAHATLHSNLTTLNGFPQATVYYEWGYDTSYGNASTSQVVTATGDVPIDIQGFDPTRTVYYRGVVECDGTNYSSGSTFIVGSSGVVTGFNMLNAIVLIAYIAMVIFAVIAIGSQSTVAALIFMAVAIYLGEAFVVAIQEALTRMFW